MAKYNTDFFLSKTKNPKLTPPRRDDEHPQPFHMRFSLGPGHEVEHSPALLSDQEIFTTPTCTSEMSNMTHPLIMIVASRILRKHKYTALTPSARQGNTSQP